MDKLDWRDYGAIPDGVFDCTSAINRSFADAIETGLESYGPKGRYRVTGPLHWNDPTPRISGTAFHTVIEPDGVNYDWLTVGNGTNTVIGPSGWVSNLRLQRPGMDFAPGGNNAGFKINGANFVDVRNVWVSFAPIGFAPVNNCYGTSFHNCRTLFDECRIGLYLQGAVPPGEGAATTWSFTTVGSMAAKPASGWKAIKASITFMEVS